MGLTGCGSESAKRRSANAHTLLRLKPGDYLSTAYIAELKSTRSAFAANKTGHLTEIKVLRSGSRLSLLPGFNFHESGTGFVVNNKGQLVEAESGGTNTQKPIAELLDENTLWFGEKNSKTATYTFVGDSASYVAQVMIVGIYHDARGRAYEFKHDGAAIFPDRTFKYDIGLDHVGVSSDYYMQNGRFCAIRRKGKDFADLCNV